MKNLMDLTGRHIVVTGAGQGIGLCAATLLAELGANLTLVEIADEGAELLRTRFPDAFVAQGSVTDRDFVQKTVEDGAARFDGLDGLLNNAGIIRTAMIEKMTIEQWQAVIDVNLTGVFNCLQAVGTQMIAESKTRQDNRQRAIVNIASDAGRRGSIGQINYAAAKSGVLGMTMTAAKEWGRYGIRTNSVCFGVVETEMTEVIRSDKFRDKYLSAVPMGAFLSPEQAVQSIAFLLSSASDFISGQHLSVNGGSHMGF
ncbi:SDR family NAD(P)-dependent oxidoreductase [Orrella sp. 11846]|uniref:SDR family NAD(P)-dependent oxidoreductase n=1 Tax=Orrella sp. 11846 TaxID=3409913 RepID=UPI003B59B871